jgi:hypothetical protein
MNERVSVMCQYVVCVCVCVCVFKQNHRVGPASLYLSPSPSFAPGKEPPLVHVAQVVAGHGDEDDDGGGRG